MKLRIAKTEQNNGYTHRNCVTLHDMERKLQRRTEAGVFIPVLQLYR